MNTDALLTTVRPGTAFFARQLDGLTESDLDGGSLLPGWTRRHVVAHVGYNARAIARLVAWADTGVETAMYESAEARDAEIATGATLSPRELRGLFDRSAAELDAAWCALPTSAWSHLVRTRQGPVLPVSDTVWMRAREVWVHGVDLDAGAGFSDIPVPVLGRLLGDVVDSWASRDADGGLLLRVSDSPRADLGDVGAEDPEVVSGSLAEVTAWACGRGRAGVTSSARDNPVAPDWI